MLCKVKLHLQLAKSIDNRLAIEVLKEIAEEERAHAGRFLRPLRELESDEEEPFTEGAEKVKRLIEKLEEAWAASRSGPLAWRKGEEMR
jgi:rubrerythrin